MLTGLKRISKEHSGKRILVCRGWLGSLCECRVIEVSPSGKYVKLRFENGSTYWHSCDEYSLVEVLD